MKTCKQILALLLALAMLFAMAACGGTEASSAEAPASVAEAPEEASTPEAPPVEEPAPEEAPASVAEEAPVEEPAGGVTVSGATYTADAYELPLFEEEETFKAWLSFNSRDLSLFGNDGYSANTAVQAAEAATGVKLEYRMISSDANSEQFSLALAGGDLDEIVFGASDAYFGTMSGAIEEEVFVDIKPYMEENMPFYTAAYNALDDNSKRSIVTAEGQIPGIFTISDYETIARAGFMIRSDYLEAVGKEVPKTYDELYDVLTAFKSELGIVQPLMLPAEICANSNALCAAFDVLGTFSITGFSVSPWYQVDGEVKFGVVEEGYYDYLCMMRQYYEEGLIYKDFINVNTNPMGSSYIGAITSGDAGMFFGETELVTQYMDGQSFNPDFTIEPMSEILKEEGQTTHFIRKESKIKTDCVSITTDCHDIEKILTYMDYFYTLEGAKLINLGVEGDTFVEVDGKYEWTEEYLDFSVYTDKEKNCLFFLAAYPGMGLDVPVNYTYDVQYICEETWIANDDGAYVLPSVSLTAEESEEYARIYSDLSTYIAENLSKFVVGENDIADWDSFIANIYDLGMQDLIDIYQKALDRFNEIDVTW